MIGSTGRTRVLAYGRPADMRNSFDGLAALVTTSLGQDPMSGDLFLFVSRDRHRAKVLFWDGTGLCLFAKRLEKGRFSAPWESPLGKPMEMTTAELQLFLEGSWLAGKVMLSPTKYSH